MRFTAGAVGAAVALLTLLHHPVAASGTHLARWWTCTQAAEQPECHCLCKSRLATTRPRLTPASESSWCHHTARTRAATTRSIVVKTKVVSKLVCHNHPHLLGTHPLLPEGHPSREAVTADSSSQSFAYNACPQSQPCQQVDRVPSWPPGWRNNFSGKIFVVTSPASFPCTPGTAPG